MKIIILMAIITHRAKCCKTWQCQNYAYNTLIFNIILDQWSSIVRSTQNPPPPKKTQVELPDLQLKCRILS